MLIKNPPHDYRTGDQLRGLIDLVLDLPDWLRDRSMLEIGSNTGDSIQVFSLFFRRLFCIDAFLDDGYMRKTGVDIHTQFKQKTAGRGVVLMQCKSDDAFSDITFYELLQTERFGFIYIDADHSYPAVKRDLLNAWPLLARGGILAGHDYGLTGMDQDGVKPAVDELFREPDCVYIDKSWTIEKTVDRMKLRLAGT
jgi:hypothetical protein